MGWNQELFDREIRHAVTMERFKTGQVVEALRILDRADRELTQTLRDRLKQNMSRKRLVALQKDIREQRRRLWRELHATNKRNLSEYMKSEVDFTRRMFDASIPLQLNYASVSAERLNGLLTGTPFAGGANAARTLSGWWDATAAVDQRRVLEALQMGMVQEETVDQMVRRVRQVMPLTRNNAAAVVRTAVNHANTQARGAFHEANADVAAATRWTATLDGRTTLICAGRDGHHAPITGKSTKGVPKPWLSPLTARPPAHPSCRSVMSTVLDPDGIEQIMPPRPFVRDARTRRQREIDFRAQAKAKAGGSWKGMSEANRRQLIKAERLDWTRKNVGTVSGDVDFGTWFKGQPEGFQLDYLGPSRYQAFKNGVPVTGFAKDGQTLTLSQLRKRYPEKVLDPLKRVPQKKWTRQAQDAWEESITFDEQNALENWTGDFYGQVRRYQQGLRRNLDLDEVENTIQHMETALARAPKFTGKGAMWRGMEVDAEDLAKLQGSGVLSDSAFASWSSSRRVGLSFSNPERYVGPANQFQIPILVKCANPRTAVRLGKTSQVFWEREVLSMPGTRYRVLEWRKVRFTGRDFDDTFEGWEVIVEEI